MGTAAGGTSAHSRYPCQWLGTDETEDVAEQRQLARALTVILIPHLHGGGLDLRDHRHALLGCGPHGHLNADSHVVGFDLGHEDELGVAAGNPAECDQQNREAHGYRRRGPVQRQAQSSGVLVVDESAEVVAKPRRESIVKEDEHEQHCGDQCCVQSAYGAADGEQGSEGDCADDADKHQAAPR